jgi:uncharacterized SAM-binding protein YcdF (DUF218 family)
MMWPVAGALRGDLREAAETLWRYHRLDHEPRVTDVGIGLGSHDPGVATWAAELYRRGLFPLLVFTGANAPTTAGRFPRGEAVHYREAALALGVPSSAVLVEPRATNTAENLVLTRSLLREHGVEPRSVTLVSRPYQQRRAYATCRRQWPAVEVVCTSSPQGLDGYLTAIGDPDLVLTMLVGDTERIERYAELGFAIPQEVPPEVRAACAALVAAGYTGRRPRG